MVLWFLVGKGRRMHTVSQNKNGTLGVGLAVTLTIQTLGSGFNPANYTFVGGAAHADDFSG